EVGDPHVVAGGGAEVLGQDQPAPVVGHVDRVVGGGVAPVAEDEVVGLGVGAEAVEADPAVEGLLAGRHGGGREAPDVVEAGRSLAAAAAIVGGTPPVPPGAGPGQRAVAAAAEGTVGERRTRTGGGVTSRTGGSRGRGAGGARAGIRSRKGRTSSSWALDQAGVAGSSASSSQR